MKLRHLLPLLAVLALSACSKQEPVATPAVEPAAVEQAPAAVEPATTAEADVPEAADSAQDTEATTVEAETAETAAPTAPPPPAAPYTGPALVPGTDYLEIPGGQPLDPLAGKVEVVEVFGYVCPACNAFQPLVSHWKTTLPGDVRFTYVPAPFGGTWDDYARAFYAAQIMGVQEKTHDALYRAIHTERTLKGERGRDSVEDIAAFYARHGVDAKQFQSTMDSFAIAGRISKAKQFTTRNQVTGTPSIVINGKYIPKGQSWEQVLHNADALIAMERAGGVR
ncbi:thiol:disulfide interchange protein [Pseudoxanthomonas kalamensis DSM 18571]|uniref:thiol:disulfide interchange protein DsbA/DsbL n=1 Tax=Pseudoxanthomonas kalamensis TaxID=289483 RepID=UPI001390B322|nr:thiol:disulfide interchange protein DsbA/DsbL [Pseudoxanthomonas kalamensis]KAF1712116.1 thiol:disulfide interchange protein [Pseudoxanthomonas kalamensis DSM 18571]